MKKVALILLSLIFFISNSVYANTIPKEISIIIDNHKIEPDVAPELKRGTTFVPISFITKELGASTTWKRPYVTIVKEDIILIFEIGKLNVIRNNEKYMLEEAPYIKNGRTMVPLRVISEQLGCKVAYDNLIKRIDIDSTANFPFIPPVDKRHYFLSHDEKWGITYKEDYVTNSENMYVKLETTYLKNMETNDMIEVFTGNGVISGWFNNETLYFISKNGAMDSGKGRDYEGNSSLMNYNIELYNVSTNQFTIVAQNIIYFKIANDKNLIGYQYRDKTGKLAYKQYNVKTGSTIQITEAAYSALQ